MKTTVEKRNRPDSYREAKNNRKQKPAASSDNALKFEKTKNEPTILRRIKIKYGKALAVTIAIGTAIIITSCSSSAEKVENAENDVLKAEQALETANTEYLADVEKYRIETRDRIEANNKSIAEFNARIESEKKEAKEEHKKQIAELEQKNTDMKKRMDDYKTDTQENWQSFKAEFSKDMDELGLALKSFVTDSK